MSELKEKKIDSELWTNVANRWGEPVEEYLEDEIELLIRGVAGGDRVLMVLKKAQKILSRQPSSAIGIFVYSKVTASYINEIAKKISPSICVFSFDDWAEHILATVGEIYKVNCLKLSDHPLLMAADKVSLKLKWPIINESSTLFQLMNEIMFIMEKGFSSESEYLKEKVDVSSLSISIETRKVFFKIYKEYLSILNSYQKINEKEYERKFYQGLSLSIPSQEFDHVFIVHGEDFSLSELLILKSITKKSFLLTADKNSEIFNTNFSWANFNIDPNSSKRRKLLDNSSEPIVSLAVSLLHYDPFLQHQSEENHSLPAKQGRIPKVKIVSNPRNYIRKKVMKMLVNNLDLSIGILGRNWNELVSLKEDFKKYDIDTAFISENEPSFSGTEVKLTTFHNAKGLKFDIVFILISEENDGYYELLKEVSEVSLDPAVLNRRLIYTGMTSAVKRLYIVTSNSENQYIKELDRKFYKILK
jgi:DNA helicase II / ATP-dependent DNA helicase PcrA